MCIMFGKKKARNIYIYSRAHPFISVTNQRAQTSHLDTHRVREREPGEEEEDEIEEKT